MNIKGYLFDTHACGHYRLELPAREINAQCANHRMDVKTNIVFSDYAGTNLMIFQRQNRNLDSVQYANSNGIATLYELDDDIWNVPKVFEEYNKTTIRPDDSAAVMRECNGIIVSTPELACIVRGKIPGKQVYVVPNAIDLPLFDEAYLDRESAPKRDTVTIGWMASQSHLMDAPLVGEVLRDLLTEFPQVRLHFIGWIDMAAFYGDILKPFASRVQCDNWVSVSALGQAMKGFDIGLLPLVDHPFNRSKSELKYFQYSALGIPAVASPLPCYKRGIEDGCGYIAENNAPAEWYRHLKALIVDADLRRSVGVRARRLMYMKHDIRREFRRWLDAYQEAVNNK
jgi:O-antigen biosynthesis protein